MRKTFILSALLSIAVFATAQHKKTLDKSGFHQIILQSFDDLFSKTLLEKIDEHYAKGFLILEDGFVWNKDSVIFYLNKRKNSPGKFDRQNKIDVVEFERNGETAWGSYYNEAFISIDDRQPRTVKWLESAVLIKVNNKWKIKLLHSTRIELGSEKK